MMNFARVRGLFPWRSAAILALVPCIPLLFVGVRFRYELQPLQRYYLAAYWESTQGEDQPNSETRVEWLFKTAPGRKREPVVEQDVVDEGFVKLSLGLSTTAMQQGWTGIEQATPGADSSTEVEKFLREDFYDHRSLRDLLTEPLVDGCASLLLLVFPMVVMREELVAEWRPLYRAATRPDWSSQYGWDSRPDRHWNSPRRWLPEFRCQSMRDLPVQLIRLIAQAVARHRTDEDKKADSLGNDGMSLRGTDRQANQTPEQVLDSAPSLPPKLSAQRQRIFPGASTDRAVNETRQPWDESQWID